MLTALLFLLGAFLLGVALVRRALGGLLSHAEQTLWGLVVGWMLSALCAYLVARAFGQLTPAPLHLQNAFVWLTAIILWLPPLKHFMLRKVRARALWRTEYAGLLLILSIFAPVYLQLFSTRMLAEGSEGIYSGGSTWYDIGFHMAVSTSFVYGQNFPPIYTPFPPEPLLYPFLPDFQTALLVALGMDTRTALLSTAVPLALAVTGLFYFLALRVLRPTESFVSSAEAPDEVSPQTTNHLRSQVSAALATILFLLNGGLGFLYFFKDWRQSNKSFADFWSHLETNYANMGEHRISWTNIIVDSLLPQRTSLYGFAVGFMVFTLFAVVWRKWSDDENGGRWAGWRVLLPAGVLTGLLPLFHTHTYAAVGLTSGFLFLLRPRRAWLIFWTPAVVLALPHFVGLTGHVAAAGFMRFQPGWRGHNEANWPLYWLRNVGLPLLLIVPAWLQAPRSLRLFYLAFFALFAFSLLVVLTPNDYDNIKLMYYWYAVTCVLVASWLVRVATHYRQRFIAALLALLSVASGLLALQSESLSRKLLFNREEEAAAAFVRTHTAPRALFLTASTIHQPILSLTGRSILRGDTAWLWSHGYEFQAREADIKTIYSGSADALELLGYYQPDFVYLGQREKEILKARQEFFDQNFPVFYRSHTISIYDLRTGDAARNDAKLPASSAPREYASRIERDPYQLLVEFPRAAFAVYRFYRVAYGRWPKYRELTDEMRRIGRGVYVGAPGWQKTLEDNKRALTDDWMSRDEFKSLYGGKTDTEYVAALYANVGVTPEESERASLATALNDGTETRASALRRVSENRELFKREYNTAYVLVHYFGYLRRDPDDAPDHNLDGFNFWLRDLDRTHDYRSLSRVFIESGEYKDQGKR